MKKTEVKIIFSIALTILLGIAGAAWPADCGGATPCSCGDNVVADRTLVSGVDPIVGTPCPLASFLGGLVMNTSGVTLDLGGNTIVGPGGEFAGVHILPNVNSVIVRNGNIERFQRGVHGSQTMDSTIANIRTKFNAKDGIRVRGRRNTVENNWTEYNKNYGIWVLGEFNQILKNKSDLNRSDGIRVEDKENSLEENRARRNGGAGVLTVLGPHFDFGRNEDNSIPLMTA